MIHSGSYKRDLLRSIRERIFPWMSSGKNVGSLLPSVLPMKQSRREIPFVETGRLERGNRLTDKHQRRRPRYLSWGLELLFAVGFYVAKRYVKSWTASLAKEQTALRSRASERRISPGGESTTLLARSERRQEKEVHTQAPKSYAARVLDLLKNTATEWSRDKCPQLGAALAYYTVFSLAPLVLVLLAVFGRIYGGSEQAREKIVEQLRYLMDPSGVKIVQDIANNAAEPKAGILATAIGILIALFGASGIFGQLQDALNTIWNVKPKPSRGIWSFVRARFLSFAMVGGVCFLLLVSLTVEGLLKGLHSYLQTIVPGGHYLGLAVFYVFDLAIIVSLFAMLFRYLPDAKIVWHDVWTGAALTAILFVIGKFLLGLYLGSGAAGSAYGAASSLVTLLLWIFYSAQILLFGAEFTKVYANTCGSHVQPEKHAVKVERKEIELPSEEGPGARHFQKPVH
jgi:membrane protein